MELLLLGSAAAEGWPAPFCTCRFCQEARSRGGKNLRSRSGALLDDDLKIDFGPDTAVQLMRSGKHLGALRTLAVTHDHFDHFSPRELLWLVPPFSQTPPAQKIEVYANEAVMAELRSGCPQSAQSCLEPRLLQALKPIVTGAGDTILPLPADHEKGALVLRITREGKSLFYGHDSGLYPAATLDALSDGVVLNIALLDCNDGGVATDNRGHMGVTGVVRMVDELRRRGAIGASTRVIATHFSHNGGMLHEDLLRAFSPHGIDVAYDAMLVRG